MFIEIISLVILLFLSGFFSSTETALTSLDKVRLRSLLKSEKTNIKFVKLLKEDMHYTLMTILLGNNLVNILSSAMASVIAYDLFDNFGVAIATAVMTFLILIFGEILPKTLGLKNDIKISLKVSPIIYYLKKLLFPLLKFLDMIIKVFIKEDPFQEFGITEKEFKSLVNIVEKDGHINRTEKEILSNVLDLSNTKVGEIKTPRNDVISLKIDSNLKSAIKIIKDSGFSRIPVFGQNLDDIKGILYAKDIIKDNLFNKNEMDFKVEKILIKEILYVPESMNIDLLLKKFQKNKGHIAIVVNEFGTVTGIVTLEDILEELVGEIYDENEVMEEPFLQVNDKKIIVDAQYDIDDFMKQTDLKISKDHFETVGGFLLKKTGRIPKKGEVFKFKKFNIKVLNRTNNALKKLEVILNDETSKKPEN
ncbi:MAG: hemolysin family protein [Candidatus Woesearchaeota archaeon]